MITSALEAASAADPQTTAPASPNSFSGGLLRLWTATEWPAFSKFNTMGLPMMPVPINATERLIV